MKKTLLFSLLVAGMLTLASCGNAPKEETAGKHNIQLTKVPDNLWETIHTTIYNYKEHSLQVNVHEGTIYYDYKL